MREVYIGKGSSFETAQWEMIDVDQSSNVTYMFASPIFEDISQIKCNRTNTYKVPATARNLRIFELVNQPDVKANFAHRKHYFMEYQDGLPIIPNGECTILDANGKDISLSVVWGNKVNIQKLSEKKLNQLDVREYVRIKSGDKGMTEYLLKDDTRNYGFLRMDYGLGPLNDDIHVDPSVRVDFVLKKIEESLGVKFKVFKSATESVGLDGDNIVFKDYWIPLTSNEARRAKGNPWCKMSFDKLKNEWVLDRYSNSYGIYEEETVGTTKKWTIRGGVKTTQLKFNYKMTFSRLDFPSNPEEIENPGESNKPNDIIFILSYKDVLGNYQQTIIDIEFRRPLPTPSDPLPRWQAKSDESAPGIVIPQGSTNITLSCKEYEWSGVRFDMPTSATFTHDVGQEIASLELGNIMPDMSAVDFLKSIMHMFGLYAYYSKDATNEIQLISLNDIYKRIPLAKDWTNKRIAGSEQRITHIFKDHKRKNWLRYDVDEKSASVKPDGCIEVDTEYLEGEKDLLKLKFAPSTPSGYVKGVACIPHYKTITEEGKTTTDPNPEKLKTRIVREDTKDIYPNSYKSGVFDEEMYFSKEGLLSTFYNTYQMVVNRPVVLEQDFYLSPLDVHNFSEIDPIYLDGNYYMPITVNVDSGGKAKCKLLQLPDPYLVK